ncbi:DUF4097 family beta strand repeat protein [Tsukamurella tyrosinosolvens]|uniref:Putative adhesin n=1 Tax=Tsukamurella tyrosinosolvens TaxID=57704 RepID=A0A1H4ZCB9_TSUTY|nr:DUF4097 family beta strand repeat-containing protein [Tsukamurella tyrosinosolvens]KXO95674.1 hypothetical protein AXK58_13380 [Tsukamurella tyrosinosolvens]KXP07096.1 hypothetical protein AXK59_03110 [Tsukamurella tyrosinosolvens]KZL98297.1 hypothetical protein AXX05_05260 [Tsukamurella tyrosinosolvens]MCA4994465.1 DUF4097 family beta strand repeat protein [Tsukamurella tyrosinosolvens]MEC4612008.1 DUF4097 family beta strand repeat-containing protein [Tsukamurella tyrosinosolvens]
MPTFPTPEPIDLAINLQVGDIDVIATDRTDTVVTVTPSSPNKAADRRGADATRVEFDGGRLTVVGPKPKLGLMSFIGATESVDVTVELPAGSRFTAESAVGSVRTEGRLAATRIKATTGTVELDTTGDLWLRAGHGNATAGTVDGTAEITADHGQIRIDSIARDAVLKASHGSIRIGETSGGVEANLSYGDLDIDRATSSVSAKTAYGAITLNEVSDGVIDLESSYGKLTVGVAEGVPAWLDLSSKEGRVRNHLDENLPDSITGDHVAVRARAKFGDIDIRRAR